MLQEIKKTNKSFTVTIQLNNSNFWIDSVYLEIGVICMFCIKFSFQVIVAMLQSCCL